MHYVYILKCANGTVYTGCTNNIEDRLKRHNHGRVFATKNRLPISIICYTVLKINILLITLKNILNLVPAEHS